MKNTLIFVLLLLVTFSAFGQPCDDTNLVLRQIRASATDSNIDFALLKQRHQVFYNPACKSNDRLIVHLVGSFDTPTSTELFPRMASSNGYKVIVLKYPNDVSAVGSCGNSNDPDCFRNYREEIVFGTAVSEAVEVDQTNSIVNRLLKLLTYLDDNHSSEDWNVFLNNDIIDWSNIIISGHSQGGGHAAYLAKRFEVDRALLFAAPNDYSDFFSAPAEWVSDPSATPSDNYYAFGNLFDGVVDFEKQSEIWEDLNLLENQEAVNVDNNNCNYENTQVLFTEFMSTRPLGGNHNSVIIDNFTPLESDIPIFQPVWEYMLGICEGITSTVNETNDFKISIYPNPTPGTIHIEGDTPFKTIEVFNATGVLIGMVEPTKRQTRVDLQPYEGTVFVRITNANGNIKVIPVHLN